MPVPYMFSQITLAGPEPLYRHVQYLQARSRLFLAKGTGSFSSSSSAFLFAGAPAYVPLSDFAEEGKEEASADVMNQCSPSFADVTCPCHWGYRRDT